MSADQLLSQLCARPDDDALRRVLADSLTERGDLRGEFIVLQLRVADEEALPAHHALAALLLKKHRAAWLGRLAPWVEEPVFSKGYLARARLKAAALADRTWRDEPTLALLEELALPEVPASDVGELLRDLPQLRGLALASSRALPHLLQHQTPWPLRRLGLAGTARTVIADLDRVAASAALAGLTRLSLRLRSFGRSAMLALSRDLAAHPLAPRLEQLVLEAQADSTDVGYAISVFSRALPGAAVTFEDRALLVTSHPTRGVSVRGNAGSDQLCKVLSGLDLPSLPRLRVVQLGGAVGELDQLGNDLRRLKPMVVELPEAWGQ